MKTGIGTSATVDKSAFVRLRILMGTVLILICALSTTSAKEPDPAATGSAYNETGYNRDSAYANIDVGAINAFNLNFTFDLPINIGLDYPENAGLSLQVQLNYNSRVSFWNRVPTHRKFLRVRRQNPFGLGFDLNLGRIVFTRSPPVTASGYTYLDSSGARHKLYQFDAAGTQFRSHDGSHLRARVLDDDQWEVSFPNGVVQVLGNHISGTMNDLSDGLSCSPFIPPNEDDDWTECPELNFAPTPPGTSGFDRDYVGWHVKQVYSLASTEGAAVPSYTVSYYGEDGSNTGYRYVIKSITDRFGRSIQFHLDTTRGVVDLSFPRFGGQFDYAA